MLVTRTHSSGVCVCESGGECESLRRSEKQTEKSRGANHPAPSKNKTNNKKSVTGRIPATKNQTTAKAAGSRARRPDQPALAHCAALHRVDK